MQYNGIGFNAKWAASISEEAFIAHESHHGLTKAQLSEAYQLMLQAGKLEVKVEKLEAKAEQAAVVEQAQVSADQAIEEFKTKIADLDLNKAEVTDSSSVQPKGNSGKSAKGNK